MEKVEIGFIGGTGLYDSSMIDNVSEMEVDTEYGSPSDVFNVGLMNGRKVAFLARHGRGHTIPPHEINFKANITGFAKIGVNRLIACCAVGSLKEDYKPGDIVIPDQFVDWKKNSTTFYNTGNVRHVSLADPFCSEIRNALIATCKDLGIACHTKGTYVCVEGPRFSTRAESLMFRNFGDIIGMTGIPEAVLAREKEMCLGILATVTDYDVWADKPVTFDEIKKTMKENNEKVKKIIKQVVNNIPNERNCICKDALKSA
ncbi:MAG: S-methyl-5'-thioadenosine phosphorylase [Candidatus Aenigmarchaeota archaeon]|nr:S-methyl-5'-thioadenosine phosphorylase [Candidatus Aenigmarchaeota archaeon]